MVVSPIRETLTAPSGTVNGVAMDSNSWKVLPLLFPVLLSQAKQEDERRLCEEDEKSAGAAASSSLLKVSQAAINLGLDCKLLRKLSFYGSGGAVQINSGR